MCTTKFVSNQGIQNLKDFLLKAKLKLLSSVLLNNNNTSSLLKHQYGMYR